MIFFLSKTIVFCFLIRIRVRYGSVAFSLTRILLRAGNCEKTGEKISTAQWMKAAQGGLLPVVIFGQTGRSLAQFGGVVEDETRILVAALDARLDAVQAQVERVAR